MRTTTVLMATALLLLLGGLPGCGDAMRMTTSLAPEVPAPDDYVGELWRFRHPMALGLAFSPDSDRLLTWGSDGYARVWNVKTGELVSELGPHGNLGFYSPVARTLVLLLPPWDLMGGLLWRHVLINEGDVYDADFSPDGLCVLTCSLDQTARLWDASTGKERWHATGGSAGGAFSQDGKQAISVGSCTTYLYDVQTGKCLREYETGPPDSNSGIIGFTPSGQCFLMTHCAGPDADGRERNSGYRVWSLETAEEVASHERFLSARDTDITETVAFFSQYLAHRFIALERTRLVPREDVRGIARRPEIAVVRPEDKRHSPGHRAQELRGQGTLG